MHLIEYVFFTVLILCSVYAWVLGGKTGRAGAAIFLISSLCSFLAVRAHPGWVTTDFGLLCVDLGCFIALYMLSLRSSRYWPIWALGFQMVAIITHIATIIAPDIVPTAYQAIASFWSIPILGVMVMGTRLDWYHSVIRT